MGEVRGNFAGKEEKAIGVISDTEKMPFMIRKENSKILWWFWLRRGSNSEWNSFCKFYGFMIFVSAFPVLWPRHEFAAKLLYDLSAFTSGIYAS